jgi:hypothetical protein
MQANYFMLSIYKGIVTPSSSSSLTIHSHNLQSIQENPPPYWGQESKELTKSTRLEEEKLGNKETGQSKRKLKNEPFHCNN